jgi:AcrR family transcriptional regulator
MRSSREAARKSKRQARSQRKREQTRTEILDAARDVVLRDGLTSFTLSAVADDLGLTKPALYYYFDSKEALVFELFLREWMETATEVQAAVEETTTGGEAVEQLIRTFFERYRHRLDMFMFSYKMVPSLELDELVGPEELARIRPINDMLYGGAEKRLRADQRRGGFPKKRNPRRFAFTAHMAVIGLLNMKAMVASIGDPLVHSDDSLLDDMCQTFRAVALGGGSP